MSTRIAPFCLNCRKYVEVEPGVLDMACAVCAGTDLRLALADGYDLQEDRRTPHDRAVGNATAYEIEVASDWEPNWKCKCGRGFVMRDAFQQHVSERHPEVLA